MSMFNQQDFNQHPFFQFGRAALVNGILQLLDHAMYDLHSPIDVKANTYDLMDRSSKPTFIRPSFKRAISLLSPDQQTFLYNKLNKYLKHLDSTEGHDFSNAFLVVSPNSVLEHVHTNIEFEQTYVYTQAFEQPSKTEFFVNRVKVFDVPSSEFFMRLAGEPVSHHVVSNDTNLKFYFVFEYTRKPNSNYIFNQPMDIKV